MSKEPPKNVLRYSKATRFGAWVAHTAMLGVILVVLFQNVLTLRRGVRWCVAGLICVGLVLTFSRFSTYLRKQKPDEILRFYRNPHYWGALLIACGITVYWFCDPPQRPVLQSPAKQPEPPPPQADEVVFPDLDVTGVVINGERSSAIINGSTIWLGEDVSGAKLIEVTESNLTVELRGATKTLPWP